MVGLDIIGWQYQGLQWPDILNLYSTRNPFGKQDPTYYFVNTMRPLLYLIVVSEIHYYVKL